jgi:NAD(P)-dependent dehydrogenase (short-subunit alcohol dehydrogenase family)
VDLEAIAARFSLHDRVAIVTGASSGLGAVLAGALATAGARVALTARRGDRIDALAATLPGAIAVAADLMEPDDLDRLVATTHDRLGAPEILLNVAGAMTEVKAAHREHPDAARRTIELNLMVPFRLAQLVHPHMRGVGRGSIVNISSISGIVGIDRIPQASYAASKRGLSGLTVELALQWARHGIRVNAVAAGFFESEMTALLFADPEGRAWVEANTPLATSGFPATPDDLVGTVLLLASDAGRAITGQTLVVDGGWTIR